MEIDKWISGYKVRSFPWIDGKTIYLNVQYFEAGQSIEQPPVWDKTIYITNDKAGQMMLNYSLDSLVNFVANMIIPKEAAKIVITAEKNPILENLLKN